MLFEEKVSSIFINVAVLFSQGAKVFMEKRSRLVYQLNCAIYVYMLICFVGLHSTYISPLCLG